MDKIYIIKTFYCINNRWNSSTDGWFETAEKSIEAVLCNYGDLSEDGMNKYALVGSVVPGMYSIVEDMCWFKWNKERGGYDRTDRPDFARGWCYGL